MLYLWKRGTLYVQLPPDEERKQANLIDLEEEGEQDYEMQDAQELDSVASVHAQLEHMPLKDQMHLAKEMGVLQDFPWA